MHCAMNSMVSFPGPSDVCGGNLEAAVEDEVRALDREDQCSTDAFPPNGMIVDWNCSAGGSVTQHVDVGGDAAARVGHGDPVGDLTSGMHRGRPDRCRDASRGASLTSTWIGWLATVSVRLSSTTWAASEYVLGCAMMLTPKSIVTDA